MDIHFSTSTKLIFLGTATVGVAIYGRYLYNAIKERKLWPSKDPEELKNESLDGSFVTLEENDGLWSSSSQYFNFHKMRTSSISWSGSIQADFSPVYVVLINTEYKMSQQEYKKYVKKLWRVSQQKMASRDAALLKEWQEQKRYHVMKVEGDADLMNLHQIAETRGVQKVFMRAKDTKKGVALGLGPARAIDVKIVLYENLFPSTGTSQEKLVIGKT